MKKLITLTLLLTFVLQANAQSNQDKAKAYYFSAVEQYDSRNYNKALEYCQEVEDLLGSTNARIEALRVKSYFNKDDIQKAKASLNTFLTLSPDESLLKEISPYITKIDAAEEKVRKQREEAERKVREKEEARIREEKWEAESRERIANNKTKAIQEAIAEGGFDKNGLKEVSCYCLLNNDYDDKLYRTLKVKGMIDKNGNEIIPIEYSSVWYLNEEIQDYIYVRNLKNRELRFDVPGNISFGLFDTKGKVILPMANYNNEGHESSSPFDPKGFGLGLLAVRKNNIYGYINQSGETVIPFKFKWAYRFETSQPIRFRRKNGKWKNPKEVPNVARVVLNNKEYYINTKGEIVYDEYENYYGH